MTKSIAPMMFTPVATTTGGTPTTAASARHRRVHGTGRADAAARLKTSTQERPQARPASASPHDPGVPHDNAQARN
jgi:hypothetical protein